MTATDIKQGTKLPGRQVGLRGLVIREDLRGRDPGDENKMGEAAMRRPGGRIFWAIRRILGSSTVSLRNHKEAGVIGEEEQRVRLGQGPDSMLEITVRVGILISL